MRVLKTGQRDLRSFSQRGVLPEAAHQQVERLEIVGDRHAPEPMVERVLSKGAFRPVERREDVVKVQVFPGPIVETSAGSDVGHTGAMGLDNRIQFSLAIDWLPPTGTNSRHRARATASPRRDREGQKNDQYE